MLEYMLHLVTIKVVKQVVVFGLTHWIKCTLRYTERSCDGLDPYMYQAMEKVSVKLHFRYTC